MTLIQIACTLLAIIMTLVTYSIHYLSYRLRWCSENEKIDFKDRLAAECDDLQLDLSDAPASPPSKRVRLDDDLFEYLDDLRPATSSVLSSATKELEEYLLEPVTKAGPLEFWAAHEDRYPRLSLLARKYLGIPASSAPVERLFSIAGKVFRQDRCRLSNDMFSRLMFIRCNKE